jgi:uncharacterized membrane protein
MLDTLNIEESLSASPASAMAHDMCMNVWMNGERLKAIYPVPVIDLLTACSFGVSGYGDLRIEVFLKRWFCGTGLSAEPIAGPIARLIVGLTVGLIVVLIVRLIIRLIARLITRLITG